MTWLTRLFEAASAALLTAAGGRVSAALPAGEADPGAPLPAAVRDEVEAMTDVAERLKRDGALPPDFRLL